MRVIAVHVRHASVVQKGQQVDGRSERRVQVGNKLAQSQDLRVCVLVQVWSGPGRGGALLEKVGGDVGSGLVWMWMCEQCALAMRADIRIKDSSRHDEQHYQESNSKRRKVLGTLAYIQVPESA
eukprot:3545961-Rhodomonas_salina.1